MTNDVLHFPDGFLWGAGRNKNDFSIPLGTHRHVL